MKKELNLANRIWEIAYPVLMYYVAITIGMFIAQLVLGTGIENYMICKIIGSIVAIPVVYMDYKKDLMMTGKYRVKCPITAQQVKQMLAVIGITICLSVALNNIISMSPLVALSEEYQNANDAFYGSTIGWELLGSALITPLLEELLHRGVVYGRLRRRMDMWPAVVISALVFAVLHFNIVQFIYAFLLGVVFALFVEKTGKLTPAVIAHVVANGIAVIRTETGFLQEMVDGSVSAWLISVGVCFIGVSGLIVFVGNKKKEEA
ncbi:MAG: CPBP family intramembrane metalloprotease [Agathobacter sp.]|nr:CPBP family intramembrane metalloprotease [Agathobacter sp.]